MFCWYLFVFCLFFVLTVSDLIVTSAISARIGFLSGFRFLTNTIKNHNQATVKAELKARVSFN